MSTTALPQVAFIPADKIEIGDTILIEDVTGPVIGTVWDIKRVADSLDLFVQYAGSSNLKGWAVTRKAIGKQLVTTVTL